MTESVIVMLAYVTETVRGLSCSASVELLMCCCHQWVIHPLTLRVWKWTSEHCICSKY